MIKLINDDCMNVLKDMKDQSVDLVVIDPPYNIGKADWDIIDDYINWLGGVFEELDRVLKNNGSFYFFHNDFLQMVELQNYINNYTSFKFKRLIVWNKRFEGCEREYYFDNIIKSSLDRNYRTIAEYCLFYTKINDLGITTSNIEENNHPTLRKYFKKILTDYDLNISKVNKKLGHRRAEHTFYINSSQWDRPTPETYTELVTAYNLEEWEHYKPYEWIEDIFWKERYTFNNQKTHHSVWNYDVAPKEGHITPKPIPLMENIILHSSNPGDIVLDCFMGSGSTGVACKNTGRRFIGIEIDEGYFKIASERVGELTDV